MLYAVPNSLFNWDFDIQDENGQSVADVRLSNWIERGAISVPGQECTVRREIPLGAYLLEQHGRLVAQAEKPSAFFREFTVTHEGRTFTLKAWSALRRAMVLIENDVVVGRVAPESFFSRRMRVELPEEMPLVLKTFVIWLTMVLWKREADASHA